MEQTYQYAWIIPFLPLPVPMLIGLGLLLFPTATKVFVVCGLFRRFIVKYSHDFSLNLSIQQ
uniref:Uncharacterized protein n=1 Tax=Helianthus annuus TaxID=4232 RepID=A0A1Y3BU56_HELAN